MLRGMRRLRWGDELYTDVVWHRCHPSPYQPLVLTNLCPKSLSQKKVWGYLENANPVTGAGHSAWRQSVVTFHLGVGDVGPGHIQEVDSTPGWYPAQG